MKNNQLQLLEESVKETKDPSKMTKEELIRELFSVRKINFDIADRSVHLLTAMATRSYNPAGEQLVHNAGQLQRVSDKVQGYYKKLIYEVGKRLGISETDIDDLDKQVYGIS